MSVILMDCCPPVDSATRSNAAQLALNVQYAPRPAIPIARIVGSSKAARWAGEFIHMDPMLANDAHGRVLTPGRAHHVMAHPTCRLMVVVLRGPARQIRIITDGRQAVTGTDGIEPPREAIRITGRLRNRSICGLRNWGT